MRQTPVSHRKDIAAKAIEQCHLFLLYQKAVSLSLVLSVTDCGLGLNVNVTDKSTKTEPGATRGNESCWKPQNLVLSVTDCRIGLTSMPQTMTYKTGQAQDEATRVVPGTTKDTTC